MNDQKLQQLAMEYAEQNSPADIEDGVTEWERWHGHISKQLRGIALITPNALFTNEQ